MSPREYSPTSTTSSRIVISSVLRPKTLAVNSVTAPASASTVYRSRVSLHVPW
jgi:hypothetical protein